MQIAMIVNNYPPKVGGVEYHVQNLAHELVQLGHKVWVLNISNTPGSRSDEGVKVITRKAHLPIADVITVPGFGTTRDITQFLIKNRIDVVSIHTRFFPMSFVGLRAAQKAGIPVVHTEHGSGFVATKNPIVWLGSRVVDLTMGRYILRHATKLFGVSEAVTAFVEKLSGRHADVFYNAITPPKPRSAHPNRPNHLVFVGRMVAGKGWDTFLDVVAQLRKEGYDVDGELLGDGAQLAAAREKISTLGMDGIVTAPGRVTPDEVRERLAGATLVNPTVLSEGFQTTLVEAIAEGGRVVTFPVPGARMLAEKQAPVIIAKEKTIASLATALRSMLENPLQQAHTEIYQNLTWPEQAKNYITVCNDLIPFDRHL
ncbi:Glycosyltransferase involved in cell wall bisynthesis [Arcanobacterium phocae]|uniref:Glycosyltransferase involved in cell wall bisynthesis n=1 Tax=Arcanobacterium phocae TaxID=131112 RepID=A0A1H2LCP1_9ACTO|nr:glycosyltransferase family 4 protein [Arcanobacterium phocae]SDU78196.1 Glycosyltransferase involved in cell wall bisynthesis [Arcanobacterium phocae]